MLFISAEGRDEVWNSGVSCLYQQQHFVCDQRRMIGCVAWRDFAAWWMTSSVLCVLRSYVGLCGALTGLHIHSHGP